MEQINSFMTFTKGKNVVTIVKYVDAIVYSIISESQKASSAGGSRKSASAFSQFSKHLVTYGKTFKTKNLL